MKPRKPLRKISKKRQSELAKYRKLKRIFLRSHNDCFVCRYFLEPAEKDLHHVRGRTHKLLCWIPGFRCVCRECHTLIHDNPAWALRLGLLAGPKEWGRMPK